MWGGTKREGVEGMDVWVLIDRNAIHYGICLRELRSRCYGDAKSIWFTRVKQKGKKRLNGEVELNSVNARRWGKEANIQE